MNIVYAPNSMLSTPTSAYTEEDTKIVAEFGKEMADVMNENYGVGLAANQIGESVSVFIMLMDLKDTVMIINPVIVSMSQKKVLLPEGCLSDPGLNLFVKRPEVIDVQYVTSNGDMRMDTLSGTNARIFQHEYDHLLGITFDDRVGALKLKMARAKQKKLLSQGY